ncbi:MAG: thymidine phosphorylase [Deltaproteobacteria bacterium]|nr:thymidine phosphorylase [Deltaproteobacteria bacterium]
MRPQDLIRSKREGHALPGAELRRFIAGVTDGSVPDYQAAALLMAIFFRGLDEGELSAWTDAMVHSGRVLDLSGIPGVKVDKHSTGGVGDKVSLCLAPLVAACGVPVPMISGRGLGHTGGTLDKLEAIPGFRTDLEVPRFVEVVREAGLSLIGQTADLAPADRRLYALRDVTSTVESIPLIASSIMSKKLAEGIDALVLDVKVGSGAFMKDLEHAQVLATTLCGIGRRAGKEVTAFLTDMNQPLGREVGNANETREALEILHGQGPDDLLDLTLQLGAEMLMLGGAAKTWDEALERIRTARRSGAGLERMQRCVELQGGDPRAVEDLSRLPQAAHHRAVKAERTGIVRRIDTERVGLAGMMLGAGRRRVEDRVDHAVGLTMKVRLGDALRPGDELAVLHYNDAARAAEAEGMLRAAIELGDQALPPPPLVYEVLR